MTLEQAKAVRHGQILYHLTNRNADGSPQRWRVNGEVKLWKRSPWKVSFPVKIGLKGYGRVTENDLRLLEVSESLAYVGDNYHIPARDPIDL